MDNNAIYAGLSVVVCILGAGFMLSYPIILGMRERRHDMERGAIEREQRLIKKIKKLKSKSK
jgi:hypothetical protein